MKCEIMLPVFVMALLVLAGGGYAQEDTGLLVDTGDLAVDKEGPMAKLSRDLAVLYDEYESYQGRSGGEAFTPSNFLLPVRYGRVVIDAVASGDAEVLRADLEALGLQKAAMFGRLISGQLPIEAIDDLAALDSLQFARPAYAKTNMGTRSLGAPQVPLPEPQQKQGDKPFDID